MNKSWNSLETGLVVKDDEEEDLEEGQHTTGQCAVHGPSTVL